jgi:hypothetical protein
MKYRGTAALTYGPLLVTVQSLMLWAKSSAVAWYTPVQVRSWLTLAMWAAAVSPAITAAIVDGE